MNKWVIITIIAALGLGGYFFLGKKKKELAGVEKDRYSVKLEEVKRRDLKNELFISGSVKALEEAVLYPRVEGKLLRNVLKEGSPVKKGETVSLIERDEVGAVYEPVVVPSTINGIVGRVYLDPGANVTRSTAVAFVVNQTQVRILVNIPERYVGKIYKGQSASFTVESLDGQTFDATVTVISPVVDNFNRSMAIELLADNSKGLLKSGMFAKVDIVLEQKAGALSLPSSDIFKDENGAAYALVAQGDIAARRNVKTGFVNGDYTEIAGLKEGDKVISFVFGIKDGSKIKTAGQ